MAIKLRQVRMGDVLWERIRVAAAKTTALTRSEWLRRVAEAGLAGEPLKSTVEEEAMGEDCRVVTFLSRKNSVALRVLAAKTGRTKKALVQEAIETFLDRAEGAELSREEIPPHPEVVE